MFSQIVSPKKYLFSETTRTDFISNFVIVNNAPAWINFDEGLKAPHPPALLLKEKGATSYLKC